MSFDIEKRANELLPETATARGRWIREQAIQLALEAAEYRSDEIVEELLDIGMGSAAAIARKVGRAREKNEQ